MTDDCYWKHETPKEKHYLCLDRENMVCPRCCVDALDGRDPNSYGGIMWIFGKFDRPFYPRPIYGTVRYLSLKAEAKRRKARR